jgi:hypothetical protein
MDIKKLIKFQDSWVAFTSDRKSVVKSAKKLEKLLELISSKKDLIVTYIPPANQYLSP